MVRILSLVLQRPLVVLTSVHRLVQMNGRVMWLSVQRDSTLSVNVCLTLVLVLGRRSMLLCSVVNVCATCLLRTLRVRWWVPRLCLGAARMWKKNGLGFRPLRRNVRSLLLSAMSFLGSSAVECLLNRRRATSVGTPASLLEPCVLPRFSGGALTLFARASLLAHGRSMCEVVF